MKKSFTSKVDLRSPKDVMKSYSSIAQYKTGTGERNLDVTILLCHDLMIDLYQDKNYKENQCSESAF